MQVDTRKLRPLGELGNVSGSFWGRRGSSAWSLRIFVRLPGSVEVWRSLLSCVGPCRIIAGTFFIDGSSRALRRALVIARFSTVSLQNSNLSLDLRLPMKDVPPRNDPPNVVGGQELLAKQSTVDEQGKPRRTPIHDVVFRPTRPVPHEDGHVTEVVRASWDIIGGPVVQVHLTTTLPGRHRARGLHQRRTDRLFVVS